MKKKLFILAIGCSIYFSSPNVLKALPEDDSWILNRQGMRKANDGKFEEAIDSFERACRLNPFNNTAYSNLACAHNNLGVLNVRSHNYFKALRHFEAARDQKPEDLSIRFNLLSTLVTLKKVDEVEKECRQIEALRPHDSETLLKLAAALKRVENNLEAQTMLEKILDFAPENPQAHLQLGKILYLNGNIDEAIFHLKMAKESNSSDKSFNKLLAKTQRELSLQENLKNFTSIHFSLSCDDNFSQEWAEDLLNIFEEAYTTVGDRIGYYPTQRAQILVLPTEDFKRVHDLPDWAGGLYDGKIRIPVPTRNLNARFLKNAAFHEYSHHLTYLMTDGKCPIWLNEGLAQMFEATSISEFERSDSAFSKEKEFVSINAIEQAFRSGKLTVEEASKVYFLSYKFTRNLVREFGWPTMQEILRNLSLNFEAEEAFKKAIGKSAKELVAIFKDD